MKKLLFLAIKDLKVMFSDKSNFFWVFGFPTLFALFFGAIFSGASDGPSGMKIGVVNDDPSEFAAIYIDKLSDNEALKVVPMQREEALDQVRRGKISAAVIIKEDFSEGFGLFNETPAMEIAVDPSRKMEAQYLQGMLAKAKFEAIAEKFTDVTWLREHINTWRQEVVESNEIDESLKEAMLKYIDAGEGMLGTVEDFSFDGDIMNVATTEVEGTHKTEFTSFQLTFPQAIIWGIMGCSATFAISIVQERQKGTFERLRLGPIRRAHILGGKGAACFVTCIAVVCFLFTVAKLGFKMPMRSLPTFILAAACVIFCFVGLMMFISTLGRTEQSAGGAGWAIFMVMAMLGGGMVPLIFLPSWLGPVSNISPIKWSILALEGGIWRTLSLGEMAGPLAVLLAIGSAAFIFGVTILLRRD